MWLSAVLILTVASVQLPSTHAATTFNLPLVQETLEVLGGDMFMTITNMINGAGNFNEEKEVKPYKKKPLYLQAEEQPGGIDGEEEDEEPEQNSEPEEKQEEKVSVEKIVQTPTTKASSEAVSEDTATSEDSDVEIVKADSDDSSQNGSSAEEEPTDTEDKFVDEFDSKSDEDESKKAEESDKEETSEVDQDAPEGEETEDDEEDEDSDGTKELIANIVHFATDRVAKKLDQMNL